MKTTKQPSKRGPGRPPKAASERTSHRVDLRPPREVWEAYEAAARAGGHVSPEGHALVAEWARAQLDAAAAHRDADAAAYRSGYQAAVREAAARIDALGRDVPTM